MAAIGLRLNWGPDGEVLAVTREDLQKHSLKLFGYSYAHGALKGLRELLRHSRLAYVYRLNGNPSGGRASNAYAEAKCSGTRGNDLKIRVARNADDQAKWDVTTLLGSQVVDVQTVASAADLADNDFVSFDGTATLAATAGTALTGGASLSVTVAMHQAFLEKMEAYAFNAIGCVNDETQDGAIQVNALYAAFARRMRDEMGVKFQAVVYRHAGDHEGVVNVENAVTDSGASGAALVYWVTGVIAGTAVNASALNLPYDGEYTVDAGYTQAQLEAHIREGRFALHRVGDQLRVLADINSLVTLTEDKGQLFRQNQTVRVADNIAGDIARVFNAKYLGRVPNDDEGRISLWADIVAHHQELARLRAIQDFDEDDVAVEEGAERSAVVVRDAVTPLNAMAKLYMTCIVQ